MTNHSRVPSSLVEITSERIASSVARPPALRITWASPSARPAYGREAVMERLELRIPITGAHRRYVERLADVRTTAPDAAPSLERTAFEVPGTSGAPSETP